MNPVDGARAAGARELPKRKHLQEALIHVERNGGSTRNLVRAKRLQRGHCPSALLSGPLLASPTTNSNHKKGAYGAFFKQTATISLY